MCSLPASCSSSQSLAELVSVVFGLQPPKRSRSARFDVIFLDEQMRITRGDRVRCWVHAAAAVLAVSSSVPGQQL